MKPLKSNRDVLTKLFMCSSDGNESFCEELTRIIFTFTLFTITVSFTVLSAFFIWKSADLEGQLYGLFQLCGCVIMIYSLIIMILVRQKNAAIFEKLAELYDKCKRNYSFNIRFT